ILKGSWGPTQTVSGVVYCPATPNESFYQEVELRLRSTVTAHSITGYEVMFRCDFGSPNSYTHIARWNGPVQNFTGLDTLPQGAQYGVKNGDTVTVTMNGSLLSVYRNGSLVTTVNDTTFPAGNPGIGFNYGVGNTNADFGFSQFSATDGLPSCD